MSIRYFYKVSIVIAICSMLSCASYIPVFSKVPDNCEKIGEPLDVNGVRSIEYICR